MYTEQMLKQVSSVFGSLAWRRRLILPPWCGASSTYRRTSDALCSRCPLRAVGGDRPWSGILSNWNNPIGRGRRGSGGISPGCARRRPDEGYRSGRGSRGRVVRWARIKALISMHWGGLRVACPASLSLNYHHLHASTAWTLNPKVVVNRRNYSRHYILLRPVFDVARLRSTCVQSAWNSTNISVQTHAPLQTCDIKRALCTKRKSSLNRCLAFQQMAQRISNSDMELMYSVIFSTSVMFYCGAHNTSVETKKWEFLINHHLAGYRVPSAFWSRLSACHS